jgi:hypothetical protein
MKTVTEQSMSSQTPLESVMDETDRNFGPTTTGSFIITRPPTHTWKPLTWLSFPILPTRRT